MFRPFACIAEKSVAFLDKFDNKMAIASAFVFILISGHIFEAVVTECGNDQFGRNAINDETGQDTVAGTGYLMLEANDPKYEIDCCGVVDTWTFYAKGTLNTQQDIVFQIWRPSAGGTYELAGQNTVSVSSDQTYTENVIASLRITVKSGDRIGWWTSGVPLIPYRASAGEKDNNYLMTQTALATGALETWSSATNENGRTYMIGMSVNKNTDPTFSNLPSTVTISNVVGVGTSLFTVTVSDVDTYDVPLLTVMMTANSDYSFDTSTYILTTAASLSGPGRTDELEFVVVDQCEHSSTSTLTVTITNEPPVIHNLPNSTYLSEDETADILLFTIDATDSDGTVTCDLVTPVPPFMVRQIPGTLDYGIYSGSNPGGFDYEVQNVYDMTISCTDGDLSDTGTYAVYLLKNAAPIFLNLQNSTGISTNSTIGTNVFQVIVSDAENDDVTFTMTCDPTPCPFEIYDSGDILVTEDLSGHTTVGYDVSITVSDAKHTVGPGLLTIILLEINDPVVIDGLPVDTSVVENTAVGSSVYTVSYSDQDTTQTHTFTMTSSPVAGLTYFRIDSNTGLISTTSTINYEALGGAATFVFTVTISDPVTSDSGVLTIDIINENEAPSFSQASYSVSAEEGPAGMVIGTPLFGLSDPDTGDTTRLSMDCGAWTGFFIMDTTSGQISYQSNYDLDLGILPTSVTCTVTVTDSGGLTDTASLMITIANTNDNTPLFSPASYSFFVNYYAGAGTVIDTVTASDADAGSYGVLTYAIDQSSLLQEHFSIDNNGVISVTVSPSAVISALTYSSSVTITATATDAGGLSDTANVVIIVSDTTTTSTTTTTDRYKKFFDESGNVTWFVFVMMLLGIAVILTVWTTYTCRGSEGCAQFRRTFFRRHRSRNVRRKDFRRPVSPNYGPQFGPNDHHTVRKAPPPVEEYSTRRYRQLCPPLPASTLTKWQ